MASHTPLAGGGPSPEEVERKIDELYRRADPPTGTDGTAGAAKGKKGAGGEKGEKGEKEEKEEKTTRRTDMLSRAREKLGAFAAIPIRTGAAAPDAAALLLADTPQGYFDQAQLMSRLTARQKLLFDDYAQRSATVRTVRNRQAAAARTVETSGRPPTTPPLATPPVSTHDIDTPQYDIRAAKATVQRKIADAHALLAGLPHQDRRLLAAVEPHEHRPPEPTETWEAPQTWATAQPWEARESTTQPTGLGALGPEATGLGTTGLKATGLEATGLDATGLVTTGPRATGPDAARPRATRPGTTGAEATGPDATGPQAARLGPAGSSAGTPSAFKAQNALAFARAQIGKPYVWGAAGPGSYDCSGLTRAAWKAAGVALPRSTADQAAAGARIPLSEAVPGDLVFFRGSEGDASHVGLYAGDGLMIHAPNPGAYVREESVFHEGTPAIHGVVRPA